MIVFNSQQYAAMENPTPGKQYKETLLGIDNAKSVCGVFTIVLPGEKGGAYHYHSEREHLIFIIKGEGVEIIEGKENPVKTGDVLFVPAGEKHTIANKSDSEMRYLGFCSCTPGDPDRVELE